jgi:hypothetical protein
MVPAHDEVLGDERQARRDSGETPGDANRLLRPAYDDSSADTTTETRQLTPSRCKHRTVLASGVTRVQRAFALLIAAQAAHSCEEYVGRLYESFPPATFVSGLVSQDLRSGFLIANVVVIGFGLWCLFWPILRGWPSALVVASIWTAIELVNGVGHSIWSLIQGGYTPGVATAPFLFLLALNLGREVRLANRSSTFGLLR